MLLTSCQDSSATWRILSVSLTEEHFLHFNQGKCCSKKQDVNVETVHQDRENVFLQMFIIPFLPLNVRCIFYDLKWYEMDTVTFRNCKREREELVCDEVQSLDIDPSLKEAPSTFTHSSSFSKKSFSISISLPSPPNLHKLVMCVLVNFVRESSISVQCTNDQG